MAVDTRAKRASAASAGRVTMAVGADNESLNQSQRQAAAWAYSGVAASEGGGPAGAGGWEVYFDRRRLR